MNDPFLNLTDYSHKASLHCNRTYFKYVLACMQAEAHMLNCSFANIESADEVPILIKQKLALTIAAAKHKYAHPDSIDEQLDQYVSWVVWDVDDGGAYVWLSNILDGLALQGVFMHYHPAIHEDDAAESECLHIKSDLDALIIATNGDMKFPATVNTEDREIVDYVSSLLERLPHPLGGKKPAF